jgi:hypothetical protein
MRILGLALSVVVLIVQIAILVKIRRTYKVQGRLFKSWQELYEGLGKRIEKLEKLERERNDEDNSNSKLRHH